MGGKHCDTACLHDADIVPKMSLRSGHRGQKSRCFSQENTADREKALNIHIC